MNEKIKRTVFAQYFGQKIKVILNSGKFDTVECNAGTIQLLNPEDILILRPLISITDEEALEMAKIFGGVDVSSGLDKIIFNRPTDITNDDIHFAVQVYKNLPKFVSYSTPKYWHDGYGVFAYQYLLSKGFDLPHYLLGEKTLFESGLCEYKKD